MLELVAVIKGELLRALDSCRLALNLVICFRMKAEGVEQSILHQPDREVRDVNADPRSLHPLGDRNGCPASAKRIEDHVALVTASFDDARKMAECDWIILCDYAFPALRGKLCMIGVFDAIYAKETPFVHPRAAIGFSVLGEPGENVDAKLEVIGPSGATLAKAQVKFVLPDTGSVQVHIEIHNLKLMELGRHAIQMDLGDGSPKSAWFTLRPAPQQP